MRLVECSTKRCVAHSRRRASCCRPVLNALDIHDQATSQDGAKRTGHWTSGTKLSIIHHASREATYLDRQTKF